MIRKKVATARIQSAQRRGRLARALAIGSLCSTLLVLPELARAQLALPVGIPSAFFGAAGTTNSYTIDLDTLPARPRLVVDVESVSGSPAAVFEIELTGFTGLPADPFPFSIGCPLTSNPSGSWTSGPMVGSARLEADLFFCDPLLNTWDGVDAQVIVRAVDLGQQGLPATASIQIEGITFVPTELLVQQVMGPRSVTVTADQDTVIYADDVDASNGAGDFLWSGTRVVPFLGAPGVYLRYPRKSLLKFGGLSVVMPPNALVTGVDLDLYVTAFTNLPPGVGVYAVAPGPSWSSGSVDAGGDGFLGVSDTSNFDVDWSDRTFSEAWSTPGGDTTTGAALATNFVSSTGPQTFSSPALDAAVQDWVDADDYLDGLLLQSPATGFASNGVQFASEDHPNPVLHPTITVHFEQASPAGEGLIDPDLADFTDEGEDFRWIYDLDEDGTFVTPIGGVCETISLPPGAGAFTYPYTYSYVGAPGYVGLDCCTWRIFSAESQVVGTGQAIFFHNLDPLDPANLPPDTDGDGILDLCDNCPLVQNGPSLGSCMTADGVNNGPCRSDLECGAGETCDLSQLDGDGDFLGNACAVPEPGLGTGLALGVMGLGLLRRRPGSRPSGSPASSHP